VLERLIGFSLGHRGLVLALALLVAAAGALSFARLPFDAFPDTTPVQVQVNTTAPALAPLEVERQLTLPIEQALGGLKGLKELRSISKFGFSQLSLVFDDAVPIYLARQQVAERLATVELPEGTARPGMGPVASGLGEVFHYLVSGSGKSLSELREVQDWIIAPQLRTVPGVAEVNSWGGEVRQVHVLIDPRALAARGLVMADVVRALERANVNVGGGVLVRAGSAALVHGSARLTSLSDVAGVVVAARDGVPVLIGDVARVVEGAELRRGAVSAAGEGEAVLGLGFKLKGENSRDVTRRLHARLDELRTSLPAGVEVSVVYERTTLVDRVLATVRTNLAEGAVLVVLVLFVFLGGLRAGLVVAAVIPLSLLVAGNAMLQLGIAGSLMSLGAIDFGLVVDSSVILVENAVRRLGLEKGARTVVEVVREAAVEVRRPTLFGELVILVVYLPVLALEGVEGKLFRPMALTVIAVLGASMILSLTVMPVLASLALTRRDAGRREPRLVGVLRRCYLPILGWALAHRAAVLGAALAVLAGGGLAATRLGGEFVPRLAEEALVINTIRLASVSLEESVRYGGAIERVLLASFPDEIARVWTRTGTGEVATDPMGVELSDVFIALKPRQVWKRASTQDDLVAALRARLADLPGMRMVFTQPIEMRVNEMTAGARADVVVKLYGDDLEVLKATAARVHEVLRTVRGAADTAVEQVSGQPVLEVEVDRAALARHGVRAADVMDLVRALGPTRVGDVLLGERRVPLAVRLADAYRARPEELNLLPVPVADGEGSVPLGQLASLRMIEGPSTIQREWGKRRLLIQANVRGRDVSSWVDEARRRVNAEVALPAGSYLRWGGQFEHLERARARLAVVVPLALLLVFLLLYLTYGRVLDALRVFTGVPFAAVGGVLALLVRGMPFSVSAGVGFIALSGVAVLADMVLVSTVRQLEAGGMATLEAVRAAAGQRLRPVIMTGLVAGLGFLPMALSTGVGGEVQRPLATVVVGGLLTSTLLSLVVLPVLYALVAGRRTRS